MSQFDYALGATPLDPEEVEGLKLRHVTTRAELDRWEQENIQAAIAWLGRKRHKEVLSEKFLCLLHFKMFDKIWKWAGTLRRSDKNIGVPHTQMRVSLRILLDDTKYWIDHVTYHPDEIAYRFHHRLVWIHLFPNGNGRHARLMTDILLQEVLGKEPFLWGSSSFSRPSELRTQYIASLRSADREDFSLLANFVRS